jgi:hypothetical protein
MVRYQVLTAASMKMTDFWDVVSKIHRPDVESSEHLTLVNFCQTTHRNIPEDSLFIEIFHGFPQFLKANTRIALNYATTSSLHIHCNSLPSDHRIIRRRNVILTPTTTLKINLSINKTQHHVFTMNLLQGASICAQNICILSCVTVRGEWKMERVGGGGGVLVAHGPLGSDTGVRKVVTAATVLRTAELSVSRWTLALIICRRLRKFPWKFNKI